MRIQEAKSLKVGEIIHHIVFKNADGTPQRWRINGKVKTWKRNTKKIKIPLKRGLYEYGYLTGYNLNDFEKPNK